MNDWQRAFVLHRKPYSETSLLLDVYAEQTGRVTLLSKGARSKQSRLKGILQPFVPLLICFSGKGTMKTLTHAEAASLGLPISGIALYSGFYINEILTRLMVPLVHYETLFQDYLSCLQRLSIGEEVESVLRTFEFRLLNNLGYRLDFMHCAYSGDQVVDTMTYQYREEKGFVSVATQSERLMIFTGKQLRDFKQLDFSDSKTKQAAKRFMRLRLMPLLGRQPLKSRELFSQFNHIIE